MMADFIFSVLIPSSPQGHDQQSDCLVKDGVLPGPARKSTRVALLDELHVHGCDSLVVPTPMDSGDYLPHLHIQNASGLLDLAVGQCP